MDFNFFEWIRQGVKRSVLMGVSDAVNQMGAPHNADEVKDSVLAFLQDEGDKTPVSRRLSGTNEQGNRKLGRSIADLRPADSTVR